MPETKCKICGGSVSVIDDPQIKVQYSLCKTCTFINKQDRYYTTYERENEEYNRHNNTLENKGYVEYLQTIIDSFITPLDIKRNILDFGSGPFPAFKILLEKQNYNVYDYDFFYNKNEEYKNHKYQLITVIEVIEHFHNPLKELDILYSLLEEGGYLLIKTGFRNMDIEPFLTWWYRRDITHVSFFNLDVFKEIEKRYNLKRITHNDKDTIILQKQ